MIKIRILAVFFVIFPICNRVQGIQQGNFILGQTVTLHCPVRVKGMGLSVKSITWEKDGKEFYKYDPDASPYAILSNTIGVQLKEDAFFNGTRIAIGPATKETAGFYTCIAELRNPLLPGLRFSINVDIELIFQDINQINYVYDYE